MAGKYKKCAMLDLIFFFEINHKHCPLRLSLKLSITDLFKQRLNT